MAMPELLVAVRHGQSQINEVHDAEKGRVEMPENAETIRKKPDSRQLLTDKGKMQAMHAGEWIRREYRGVESFNARYVSSFFRTRQTAAYLSGLSSEAQWTIDNRLVERGWGVFGAFPIEERERAFPYTARMREVDPWFTRLENGESFEDVVLRWRDFQGTLHRENGGQKILIVTHGDFMNAIRATVERMLPEDWQALDEDKRYTIRNGAILVYSRLNPESGRLASRISWRRMIYPDNPQESPDGGEWVEIAPRRKYTPVELLAQVGE